jgi:hypothetical protein
MADDDLNGVSTDGTIDEPEVLDPEPEPDTEEMDADELNALLGIDPEPEEPESAEPEGTPIDATVLQQEIERLRQENAALKATPAEAPKPAPETSTVAPDKEDLVRDEFYRIMQRAGTSPQEAYELYQANDINALIALQLAEDRTERAMEKAQANAEQEQYRQLLASAVGTEPVRTLVRELAPDASEELSGLMTDELVRLDPSLKMNPAALKAYHPQFVANLLELARMAAFGRSTVKAAATKSAPAKPAASGVVSTGDTPKEKPARTVRVPREMMQIMNDPDLTAADKREVYNTYLALTGGAR